METKQELINKYKKLEKEFTEYSRIAGNADCAYRDLYNKLYDESDYDEIRDTCDFSFPLDADELDFNDKNKQCFNDYKIESIFSLANISYFDICKLAVFDVLDFDDLINVLSKFLKSKLEMIEDKEQINKSRDLNSYERTIGEEILSKYNIDS